MWVSEDRREALLVEYELSQQMHNYYGRIAWQIGAILLGGGTTAFGLVVSATAGELQSFLPLSFWILFAIMISGFLLITRRCRALSYIYLLRCMEIEEELGLRQQIYAEEAGRREVLIRGEARRLPSPGGWPVLVTLCVLLLALTLIIALHLAGLKIVFN